MKNVTPYTLGAGLRAELERGPSLASAGLCRMRVYLDGCSAPVHVCTLRDTASALLTETKRFLESAARTWREATAALSAADPGWQAGPGKDSFAIRPAKGTKLTLRVPKDGRPPSMELHGDAGRVLFAQELPVRGKTACAVRLAREYAMKLSSAAQEALGPLAANNPYAGTDRPGIPSAPSCLGDLMAATGAAIRAVPLIDRHVFEDTPANRERCPDAVPARPDGYSRDMLVLETVPERAGKFLLETGCGTGSCVRFSNRTYYDSLEDAVRALQDIVEKKGQTSI